MLPRFLRFVIFHSPRELPAERFHFLFRREAVGRAADADFCRREDLRPRQCIRRAVSLYEIMQKAAEQGIPCAHGVNNLPYLHGGQGEHAAFLPEVHGRALGSPAENNDTVSVSVPQRPQEVPVVPRNSLVAEKQNVRTGHKFPVEFVVDIRKHVDVRGNGFPQRLCLMEQRAAEIDVAGGHHVGIPANVLRKVVGIDVFQTMTESQGSYAYSTVTYPTGSVSESADDLHSASYISGSLAGGGPVVKASFVDDYTNISTNKNGMSKIGYSFTIGIIAVFLSYLIGVPVGIIMALRKDKLLDHIGTFYIVFITAVPSLAYIFLFKSLGDRFGLPTTFDMENPTWLMYVLPIISLSLPSIANLMKWLRRYMIDQMNSDYVKFARSGGLSEGEIFRKHILKNAIIPIVHDIPASILFALTGAIITERVYVVPGVGNMLTRAINAYDNGVIVGMVLFYAVLTVTSVILGDVLMSVLDPRISFTAKAR